MATTYTSSDRQHSDNRDMTHDASRYIIPAIIAAAVIGLGLWALSALNDDNAATTNTGASQQQTGNTAPAAGEAGSF